MNILLLYPTFPDTFWSFKHALSFVNKKATNPPLGLITVAAMLPSEWHKRLVDLNVSKLRDDEISWADMVLISAMEIQQKSVREIIERVKNHGKIIVAGGPLFTGEYQRYPDVDHFILNEAEITLPQFLADLESGIPRRVYATDDYPDIQQTPAPLWSLLDLDKYDSMAVQFSRGCPFNCDFCNVTALLGHRPRVKTLTQLINEIDQLYKLGWRRNIFLVDDNFIGNKKILKEQILPALIAWRKDKQGCLFLTEVSINLVDDEELMTLMAQAGFTNLFVGIETPDESGLTECNKKQNKNRNLVQSVKTLQHHGLQVMAGFIVGFDSDTPGIFQQQIDFIQESGIITAMVGLLQAPYGTQLYARMKSENRLIDEMTGDNMDGTSNIIPMMDSQTLHKGYRQILSEIYSPRLLYQRIRTFIREYQPAVKSVHLEYREIIAFFKSILKLGILEKERVEYWKLFFWTLRHFPDKFPLAITLTIYGYHFRKVCELHVLPHMQIIPHPVQTNVHLKLESELIAP